MEGQAISASRVSPRTDRDFRPASRPLLETTLAPAARESRPFLRLASSELLEAPVPLRHVFLRPSHPGTLEAPALTRRPFLRPAPSGTLEATAPTERTFLRSLPSGTLEALRPLSLSHLRSENAYSFSDPLRSATVQSRVFPTLPGRDD